MSRSYIQPVFCLKKTQKLVPNMFFNTSEKEWEAGRPLASRPVSGLRREEPLPSAGAENVLVPAGHVTGGWSLREGWLMAGEGAPGSDSCTELRRPARRGMPVRTGFCSSSSPALPGSPPSKEDTREKLSIVTTANPQSFFTTGSDVSSILNRDLDV